MVGRKLSHVRAVIVLGGLWALALASAATDAWPL
jgi:hypothetical protein